MRAPRLGFVHASVASLLVLVIGGASAVYFIHRAAQQALTKQLVGDANAVDF